MWRAVLFSAVSALLGCGSSGAGPKAILGASAPECHSDPGFGEGCSLPGGGGVCPPPRTICSAQLSWVTVGAESTGADVLVAGTSGGPYSTSAHSQSSPYSLSVFMGQPSYVVIISSIAGGMTLTSNEVCAGFNCPR
jgi:hypothetical protein